MKRGWQAKQKKKHQQQGVQIRQNEKFNSLEKFLHYPTQDLYHWLLSLSWLNFLALISLFYLFVNIVFAFAYLTTGEGIANAQPGSFSDAFFFSVQSMSTIGYGAMYPQTLYAQMLVTLEVLAGLLLVAMATGLMFARFSRPTARVIFSDVAVICDYNGIPTFMFRAANQRANRILEAKIQVTLLRNEISREGYYLRRFYDLKLTHSQTPFFAFSWLVMHPIDKNSPLYLANSQTLVDWDTEIWVTLTGTDETFAQMIHARYIYRVEQMLWSMRFVDIFYKTAEGDYVIDYNHFHDVLPSQ
ncbi:MAG: ATP-sensitive inward rectifier potassium channel 10 [Cyanobacteria bacterium J083]|nr:MAG: ATP-sensitive inward rectifier potassium channel 10 [Cyanobacteria bacterium J083]